MAQYSINCIFAVDENRRDCKLQFSNHLVVENVQKQRTTSEIDVNIVQQ